MKEIWTRDHNLEIKDDTVTSAEFHDTEYVANVVYCEVVTNIKPSCLFLCVATYSKIK